MYSRRYMTYTMSVRCKKTWKPLNPTRDVIHVKASIFYRLYVKHSRSFCSCLANTQDISFTLNKHCGIEQTLIFVTISPQFAHLDVYLDHSLFRISTDARSRESRSTVN